MMPNTSVNPAASRNSSRPNCSPLSSCSTTTSMDPKALICSPKKAAAAQGHCRLLLLGASSHARLLNAAGDHTPEKPILLHRALFVEAVLVVLDDGGDRFQHELALGVLDHVLQVEILD